MQKGLSNRAFVGLLLPILIMAAIGWLSYRSITGLIEVNRSVALEQKLLQKLVLVRTQLREAEREQRDYIITGDANRLTLTREALDRVERSLEEVAGITRDIPSLSASVPEIVKLASEHREAIEKTLIERRDKGFGAAVEMLSRERERDLPAILRTRIAGIEQATARDIEELLSAEVRRSSRTIIISAIGSLISLGLLILAVFMVRREIQDRQTAESTARQARDEMEVRVTERTAELTRAIKALRESESYKDSLLSSLRDAQSRLQGIFDSSRDAIAYTTLDGLVLEVNEAFLKLTGFSREELIGKKRYEEFTPLEYHDQEERLITEFLATNRIEDYEKEYVRKDGSRVPVLISPFIVRGEDGSKVAMAAIVKDLTESKRSERKIIETQKRIANIVESAMDAIVTIDSNGRIVLFNTAAEQMFEISAEKAIGRQLSDFIPERFRQSHPQHIENFGRTKVTRRSMGSLGFIYGLRAGGEEFPIEASISQMESGNEKFFTVILRDVTERKRVEERLREQAALLNQIQEAIIACDLEGRIMFWNRGAEKIYGWMAEEVIGQTLLNELYPERTQLEGHHQALQTLFEKGEWAGELRQSSKSGKELTIDSRWTLVKDEHDKPRSILVVNDDISEKKMLEAQLLRTQRLESLGTLAGGIAHDLNNVLTPVLMSIQILQMRLTDEEILKLLDVMQKNVERGAEMIKQVLLFARGSRGERITLQPKHLVKEITGMLSEVLPKSIEIRISLPEESPWLILGDATQLQQVLMNLCLNARDAMPNGGILKIEVENTYLDEMYTQMIVDAKPGRYLVIKVSDSGEGIPPGMLHRIFEPFFTTKERGKGTGLGLATVLGIVQSHGGFINVYSEPGKGTQFSIYLPSVDAVLRQSAPGEIQDMPTGHGELLLVIDDEPDIREVAKRTLENCGYRVLTAGDGTEAVAIYADHPGQIKVVLTDMMMPFMDGPSTIRALQRLDPKVRIIATSGLDVAPQLTEDMSESVKKMLNKPFTADKLLAAIEEVLKP